MGAKMLNDPKKSLVIFSEKAYMGIVAETYERVSTETGGLFLGKFHQGTWYVLETVDPGPNSVFQPAYFEYDTPYVNHLANKIERFYKSGLQLLGLWHRHPGNFRKFSSTDDGTNYEFARRSPNGAISALVNLAPDFTLTIYQVDNPLRYTQIHYLVDDSLIPPDFTEQKTAADFLPMQKLDVLPSAVPVSKPAKPRWKPRLWANPNKIRSWNLFPAFRKSQSRIATKPMPLVAVTTSPVQPVVAVHEVRLDANMRAPIDSLLDMVDNELVFLQSQMDYKYSLNLQNNELIVSMNYIHQMEYYPKKLEFAFGMGQVGGYARIDGNKFRYTPNFIMEKIYHSINNYYTKE